MSVSVETSNAITRVSGPFDLTALAGAPRSFSPHGYVRGDGRNVVVSYSTGMRIRELALEGSRWVSYDLNKASGGSPRGYNPRGYVRSDGFTAVVYNGLSAEGSRVHELALTDNGWVHHDLTAITGAGGAGPLRPYVRHDGRNVIVYRGDDGHIHELALEPGGWRHYHTTLAAGASTDPDRLPSPGDVPVGFARNDGASSVVFRSLDGEIRQLKLTDRWRATHLTNDSGDPKATYGLAATVRPDGFNVVYYAGKDRHLHELGLVNGEWMHSDITATVGSSLLDPAGTMIDAFPMVRSGRQMTSVVFHDEDRHVNELRLDGADWHNTDRTSQTGAPTTEPFMTTAYQRSDGLTAFVFSSQPDPDHHVFEIVR
jgi:hypothetical protein